MTWASHFVVVSSPNKHTKLPLGLGGCQVTHQCMPRVNTQLAALLQFYCRYENNLMTVIDNIFRLYVPKHSPAPRIEHRPSRYIYAPGSSSGILRIAPSSVSPQIPCHSYTCAIFKCLTSSFVPAVLCVRLIIYFVLWIEVNMCALS
jgi:hypothetical protein